MEICKKCYIPMISVMSFSKDRHEKYYRCPRCYGETKHDRMNDSVLNFREELYKAIKRKGI